MDSDDVAQSDSGDNAELNLLEEQDEGQLASGDTSDDDAPEDVSVQKSKDAALVQMQNAVRQIQQEKTRLREKRRLQQEKNIHQKKRAKPLVLQSKRLDDDILQSLPPEAPKEDDVKAARTPKKSRVKKAVDTPKAAELPDNDKWVEEDYISLSKDQPIKPVCIDNVGKTQNAMEKALAFKNQQFYGSSVRRDKTSKDLASRKAKKKAFSGHP